MFKKLSFIFFCVIAVNVFSQTTIIRKIEVRGNKVVSNTEVLDVVSTRPGDDFSSSRLREDLRSIYKMGSFMDASIEVEDYKDGLKVIFVLVEKPSAGEIKFRGRKSIWESTLKDALDIKKGDTCAVDELRLKQNERKILNLYEERGFPFATVSHEIEVVKDAANITFIINEGPRVKVDEVNITGNKFFSTKTLLGKMRIRPGRWYSETKLEEDLEKIADFYRDEGFILVDIEPPQAGYKTVAGIPEKEKPKEKFTVNIKINEGPQIKVERIQVKGNTIFSEKEIREKMLTKERAIFNQSRFIEDMRALQGKYAEKGYILCRITPLTDIDEDSGNISIVVDITEEELVYIENIKIEGNLVTKDKVIRRELTIKPGEIFNTQKIIRSRQKIYNLGFFEEVDISTEPGTEKGKMILVVKVKEKKTGMMSFGAGYNSIDGLMGYIEYSKNNFLGLGQYLSLKYEFGAQKQNIETSFVEPWFLNTPTSVGIDLFHTVRDRPEYYYKEKRIGGNLNLGRPVTDYDKLFFRYKYESVEIFDIAESASQEVKSQKGINVTSSIALSYVRDTRDNIFDASSGIYLNLSTEISGGILGGNNNFYRPTIDFSTYSKLLGLKWLVLAFHMRAGTVDSYACGEVPVYEKFYGGGADTVRGYPERSLPENATGGKTILFGNAEIRFPIPGTENLLKGILFFDIGNVWKEREVDFSSLKKGAGMGIRINTPVGIIRFDFGYRFDSVGKYIYADRWEPHFSIGQMF